MDDFNFEEEPKPFEPVHLKGFSRYLFHPEGTCYDTLLKRWIKPNRFLNFLMFPDNGGEPVVDNMRQIISFLVKAKIPGFTEELPPYMPPPLYEAVPISENVFDALKPKELRALKDKMIKATDLLLEDIENQDLQDKYRAAKAAIDTFKQDNPDYYKWPVFKEPVYVDPVKEKELLEEEQRLHEELREVDEQIRAVRKRLIGVLETMGFYKKNENQKSHGLLGAYKKS